MILVLALPVLGFEGLPGAPTEPAEPPAGPAEPPVPTVNGLWEHTRPDGTLEYLEIFGRRRFVYRDSRGGAVSGEATVAPRLLTLRFGGIERVFVYDLGVALLRLTPDSADSPGPLDDLSRMPPTGGETAVYRRRGAAVAAWDLGRLRTGDLVGSYRYTPAGGREESLELRLDGRYRYLGPSGLTSVGRFQLEDGLLILREGDVERRFLPDLTITATAWVLTLRRDETDQPRFSNDLHDLAPRLRSAARWERPLVELTEEDLLGGWRVTDDFGEHRLILEAGGNLRVGSLPGEIVPGRWRLEGSLLTLEAENILGQPEARRFVVQPLPGALLLVRDDRDQPLRGENLRFLPPLLEPYARYVPL